VAESPIALPVASVKGEYAMSIHRLSNLQQENVIEIKRCRAAVQSARCVLSTHAFDTFLGRQHYEFIPMPEHMERPKFDPEQVSFPIEEQETGRADYDQYAGPGEGEPLVISLYGGWA